MYQAVRPFICWVDEFNSFAVKGCLGHDMVHYMQAGCHFKLAAMCSYTVVCYFKVQPACSGWILSVIIHSVFIYL